MEGLYEKLLDSLQNEDKEAVVTLCIDALEKKYISVVDLYKFILTPAINSIMDECLDEDDLIWKEHVRSGIIRTIIELAYPYVLKERNKRNNITCEKVIVMCPRFEDHELGAKMVSDIFTINGYETTFIGANTPEKTILKAVAEIKPKYISISVTNYYNLVSAKNTIDIIKNKFSDKIVFVLGGRAFVANPNSYKEIGGDLLLNSFEDILNLNKDGGNK